MSRRSRRCHEEGPHSESFLQGNLWDITLEPYRAMAVGEAFGVTPEQAILFTDAQREELHMIFHFDHVRMDRDNWRKTE